MRQRGPGRATVTVLAAAVALISFISVSADAAKHTLRKGDTLWDIAKKNHTTVRALARANGISENATLGIGKSVTIPGQRGLSHKRGTKHYTHLAAHRSRAKAKWVAAKRHAGCSNRAAKSASKPTSSTRPVYTRGSSTLIQTALACRGASYHRGGTSRGGFDCSGFTRYIYARYGISLPHSSAAQARIGTPISRSELRPGDLVFFRTYRRGISHVGIYIGNGRFIHASTHRGGVRVDSLNHPYYTPRYRGARRVK